VCVTPPEPTPPVVCEHDAHCPTCYTCTECYPHQPGTWVADGVTEPCRSAALLRHLSDLDQLEQITSDIAERSARPRDQRHAGYLLDDIRADRDRMLGTEEL
jgi:hypothetical protein